MELYSTLKGTNSTENMIYRNLQINTVENCLIRMKFILL